MVADLKFIFLSIVLISSLSGNNITNKDIVLNIVEKKVVDSYKELNEKITFCFDNQSQIILDDIKYITKFKERDIFNVVKNIFNNNFNNCLDKKDHLYVYNLGMLYIAQKKYDINTTETIIKTEDYFEPILDFENNTEYINAPKELKKYLHKTLGTKTFTYPKTMKVLIEHYRKSSPLK